MKIPEEIMVNGHQIKVIKVKSDVEGNPGVYHTWYQTIKINVDDNTEDMQAEAFLHEIFEAIRNKFNLKIEHSELTLISEVLFDTIRRNGLDFRFEGIKSVSGEAGSCTKKPSKSISAGDKSEVVSEQIWRYKKRGKKK